MTIEDNAPCLTKNDLPAVQLQACLSSALGRGSISNISFSYSSRAIAVLLDSKVLEIYSCDNRNNWILTRSVKFDQIRSVSWTGVNNLAVAASCPANVWLDDHCLEHHTWVDHLAGAENVLTGVGRKGANATPFVWAWDPFDRVRLWTCQLSCGSGKACFCLRLSVDGAVIVGLDSGVIHIIREGIEILKITNHFQFSSATIAEPFPKSNPCLLISDRSNSLYLKLLTQMDAVKLPIPNPTAVSSICDLIATSSSDGLFSIHSVTAIGKGPLLIIPFSSGATSIAFHPSAKLFAVAFRNCLQIYGT